MKNIFFCQDIFPDVFTERKICSLPVKCSSAGCKWIGELREKEVYYVCTVVSENIFITDIIV